MHGTLSKGAKRAEASAPVLRRFDEGAKAPEENSNSALRVNPSGLRAVRGYAPDTPARFVMGLRNNPESVVIDAESQIPADYMREIPASYSPDRIVIKKAIQDGYEVPGCHLTRTQSLQIK